ncbi:MAG: imidazolonepropionase [Thermoproteota archaeon]|nr:imidazolonepropionase [Thermoproteota archaeon]
MKFDLAIKAKQAVTLKGGIRIKERLKELAIVEDALIGINGEKVTYVGEEKNYEAKQEISAQLVMPAFIDAHTHLLFFGSREDEFEMRIEGLSYSEILKKGGGIWRTVNHTRKASDEEILRVTKERIEYMLEHGTTVIEIKSGYGIEPSEELRELRLINKLKHLTKATIIPTLLAHLKPSDKWIDEFINLIPIVVEEKLAEFIDSFCDLGALSYEDTSRIFSIASKYGLKLKAHVGELADIGCGALVKNFNLVSMDHIIYLDDTSLDYMIEKKTCGVILPATSFSLMSNYADVRKYIDKGLIIALASDFSPASWINDMQSVISIACRTLKMTQAECISASTINAAYALGLHEKYGSIEEGKFADLICLNVPNYKWIGYTLGYNHIGTVIKHGKVIFEK